jgi:hypothetical protein
MDSVMYAHTHTQFILGIVRGEAMSYIKLDISFYLSNNSFCHLPDINHINSVVPILEGGIELKNKMKKAEF